MIDRPYLKERGKACFQRNYWMCVVVAFILTWAIGTGSTSTTSFRNRFSNIGNSSSSSSSSYSYDDDELSDLLEDEDLADIFDNHGDYGDIFSNAALGVLGGFFLVIFLIVLVIALALNIFVKNPLQVGCRRYFTINAYEKPQFNEVGFGFKKGQYMSVVKVMFMKNLFLFLFSLPTYAFFIGGIIPLLVDTTAASFGIFIVCYILGLAALVLPIYKGYEYVLVEFIVSEDPQISYKEAISQSKQMMNGYKWAFFVLQLSFIGWQILSAFTCGILGWFWTNPYVYATQSEFFLDIRTKYFGPNVQPYYTPAFAGGYGQPNQSMGGQSYNGQAYGGQPYNPDPYAQPGAPSAQDPYGMPPATTTPDPYGQPPANTDPYGQTYGSDPGSGYYNPDSNNDDTPFGI